MDEFKIVGRYPTHIAKGALDALFAERLLIKRTSPKWENFGPVVMGPAFIASWEQFGANFKIYEDDVFLVGFQRCGTSLLQEVIWLVMNDFNFEAAKSKDVYNKAQWFDYFNVTHPMQGVSPDYMENMPRPRVLKSHYPVQFIPDQVWTVKPKIIHVTRDVKDAACSLYHYRMDFNRERLANIEESFDDILEDKIWYGPYREHILNWQNLPDYDNIIYLNYEEIVADMGGTVRKIAKFLNKPVTEEQIAKTKEHVSFDRMKKTQMGVTRYLELFNSLTGEKRPLDTFVRKGKAGGYRDEMSEEYAQKFDAWYADGKNLKQGYTRVLNGLEPKREEEVRGI